MSAQGTGERQLAGVTVRLQEPWLSLHHSPPAAHPFLYGSTLIGVTALVCAAGAAPGSETRFWLAAFAVTLLLMCSMFLGALTQPRSAVDFIREARFGRAVVDERSGYRESPRARVEIDGRALAPERTHLLVTWVKGKHAKNGTVWLASQGRLWRLGQGSLGEAEQLARELVDHVGLPSTVAEERHLLGSLAVLLSFCCMGGMVAASVPLARSPGVGASVAWALLVLLASAATVACFRWVMPRAEAATVARMARDAALDRPRG